MAQDKRELILARVFAVYTAVADANNGFAFRNRLDIPENKRPAIILLDADESPDESAYARKRPANGPAVVGLTPETYILASGDSADIGTTLNTWRSRIIKAILTDETLLALSHDGDIRYAGFATGLANGRSMEGEAGLSFVFNYMLFPSKL